MIKVKVKDERFSFTVPVPYSILSVGCHLITSELFWRQVIKMSNKQTEHNLASFIPTDKKNTKRELLKLIRVIHDCKGIVLVDVTSHDGTNVVVKL